MVVICWTFGDHLGAHWRILWSLCTLVGQSNPDNTALLQPKYNSLHLKCSYLFMNASVRNTAGTRFSMLYILYIYLWDTCLKLLLYLARPHPMKDLDDLLHKQVNSVTIEIIRVWCAVTNVHSGCDWHQLQPYTFRHESKCMSMYQSNVELEGI